MTEPTRWVILDDRDSRVRWSGSWDSVSGDNFNNQGNFGETYRNTLHGSNTDGSGLSATFTGNAARIMGTTDLRVTNGVPDPDWECILDGRVVARRDPFPYTENNWVFCSFTNLVAGQHTIGLNIKTTGRSFWIDQIQYRPTGTVENEVVAATRDDVDMVYSSGWGPLAEVAHNTMVRGSTVTFRFVGSGVSLWGMYPKELPHADGQGTYAVDGGSPVSFTIRGGEDMSHYNRRIFSVSGLSRQAHSIVVTYTSTGGSTPLVVERMLIEGGTNQRAPQPGTGSGPTSDTSTSTADRPTTSTSTTADIVPGQDQASSLANSGSTTIFVPDATNTVGNHPTPTDIDSSGLIGDGNGNGADNPESSGAPIGAIVGAVVGGIAVILLLLGALWYRRRRRIRLLSDPGDLQPFSMVNNNYGNPPSNFQPGFQPASFPPPTSTYYPQSPSVVPLGGSHQGFDSPPTSEIEPPSAPAHAAVTKGGPAFNSPYISNHSPYHDYTVPAMARDISSSTHLVPATHDTPPQGNHSRGNSTSQSVSATSQYTNNSNLTSLSSTSYYHQDSGVRIPPHAAEVAVEEFPPMYTAR